MDWAVSATCDRVACMATNQKLKKQMCICTCINTHINTYITIFIWQWVIMSLQSACVFSDGYAKRKIGWPGPELALLCQAQPSLDRLVLTLSVSCSPRLWLGPAWLGMPRTCSAQPELAWPRPGSGAAAWLDSTGVGLAQLGSTLLFP